MTLVKGTGCKIVGKGSEAHIVEYEEWVDITGREDRDNELCQICEFDDYPNCKELCFGDK